MEIGSENISKITIILSIYNIYLQGQIVKLQGVQSKDSYRSDEKGLTFVFGSHIDVVQKLHPAQSATALYELIGVRGLTYGIFCFFYVLNYYFTFLILE